MLDVQAANGKRTVQKFEGLRRFALADLSEHGPWILGRLLKLHPHLDQRTLAGYMRGMVDSNDFLFLYQPNSVALFSLERGDILSPKPVVREHFVFIREPDDAEHLVEAGAFYEHVKMWSKNLGAEFLMLSDKSDVPLDKIQRKLGKTFERQVSYARV